MTTLIKIGNSKGIRIPKAIIKQANLENANIEFDIEKDGLLLRPVKKRRQDWEEKIDLALKDETKNDDELNDWLDMNMDI